MLRCLEVEKVNFLLFAFFCDLSVIIKWPFQWLRWWNDLQGSGIKRSQPEYHLVYFVHCCLDFLGGGGFLKLGIGLDRWAFSPLFSMVNFLRVFGRLCLLSKILFQEKKKHVRASLCPPAALLIAIWPAALAGFSHPFSVAKIHFYRIHWTGIFTQTWLIFMVKSVGKYTSPMDPMGFTWDVRCWNVAN